MTTTVYRMPETREKSNHSCLIAHLREISPREAITKLQALGVLAIPGPGSTSITLLGYQVETRLLLRDLRVKGYAVPRRYVHLWKKLSLPARHSLSKDAFLARKVHCERFLSARRTL
jgi:hypothetical protein